MATDIRSLVLMYDESRFSFEFFAAAWVVAGMGSLISVRYLMLSQLIIPFKLHFTARIAASNGCLLMFCLAMSRSLVRTSEGLGTLIALASSLHVEPCASLSSNCSSLANDTHTAGVRRSSSVVVETFGTC